jgi:hypothetical protein
MAVSSLLVASTLTGCTPPSADVATYKDVATRLVALRLAASSDDSASGNAALELTATAGRNSTTALGSAVTNGLNEFVLAAQSGPLPASTRVVSQSVVTECLNLGVTLSR